MKPAVALAVVVLIGACSSEPPPPLVDETLGGVVVSGQTLHDGAKIFSTRCATCHGPKGDGEGPTGRQQKPKPRDFRIGFIKFASVPVGELPTDADYARNITHGLRGTNMLALPLTPSEVEAVTQFVKTYSPRWREPTAKAGTPVVIPSDPWGDPKDAIERGRAVTHTTAGCIACHPSALSRDEIETLWSAEAYAGDDAAVLRAHAHRADLKDGVTSETIFGWIGAPAFEGATFKAGNGLGDVARVLASGVGGSRMVGMTDKLSDRDFWAVVHYLRSVAAPE